MITELIIPLLNGWENRMLSFNVYILIFLMTLVAMTLACGLPTPDILENKPPAIATAEEAARVAAEAAKTAAAQAGALAGTAAVVATTEGSQAIGTAQAVAAPHADYLKEKLASIEPDEDGNYRVTLTEDEVNTVIRLRQLLTGDFLGAGVQSQQAEFRDGTISLKGRIVEPLPGEFLVVMRPSIVEGRLILETETASLAGRDAPEEVLASAEDAIENTVGEALENAPGGIEILEITAVAGELTITGRKVVQSE